MSARRGGARAPGRLRAGRGRGESGALMMFVLMAILLVGAITVSAIQIIGADVVGAAKEIEADQVYNIAQAGIHYAIGQLQQPNGASTGDHYAGETKTITSGSTTLGTAAITVNCVDTTSSNGWAPPCSSSAYPGYRRIIAKGTLPVSGPSRTIVAVVQGTSSGGGGGGYALCSTSSIEAYGEGTNSQNGYDLATLYGNIAANGSMSLTPPLAGTTFSVLGDPGSPQKYTGKAMATGTITCGSGCSVAGGMFPGQAGPLCTAPTLPTFAPGSTPLTVASGTTYTINSSTGYSFSDITVNDGPCTGAIPFTTLQIQTSTTDPTATTVVQLNTLHMGICSRLMILGVGKVDLRIGAPTGESLIVAGNGTSGGTIPQGRGDHFGVGPSDTFTVTAPVAASRLIVSVNSNGTGSGMDCDDPSATTCAVFISHSSGGATINAPNGLVEIDDHNIGSNDGMTGAVASSQVAVSAYLMFNSDTSGLSGSGGSTTYSNFNQLMSWKDQ